MSVLKEMMGVVNLPLDEQEKMIDNITSNPQMAKQLISELMQYCVELAWNKVDLQEQLEDATSREKTFYEALEKAERTIRIYENNLAVDRPDSYDN